MAPSLNFIQIHGCLVFHVVPELPNRSALLSSWLLEKSDAVNDMERHFLKVWLRQIAF